MDSQNPSQEQHSQQSRRRPGEAAGGGGQNQLPHPPPQACPRCNSNNTKFCYYNNYSLAQPRYFCKGCRRYWTQGGTLRTVPVGGGSRKRKRVISNKTTSSSATATSTVIGGHCSSMEQQRAPFNFELTGSTSLLLPHTGHTGQNLHPTSTSLLGTPINTNTGTLIYGGIGGGSGGFFSSLAGFPPVSFGPNLGLLNGLGLPSLDHHHNGLPQHQEEPISFQQLLQQHHNQNLHPGSISSISSPPAFSSDWLNKTENNNDDPNHWPDFEVGNNDIGLEDP